MTRPRLQLTVQEYRARLSRLKEWGIPIDSAAGPSPEPDRLILEPINPGSARLYELPSGAVIVTAPARLTVLISEVLITDHEMIVSLDDCPLELDDPEEWEGYTDVIDCLPYSAKVLNPRLTRGQPLRRQREEGVILGMGWCKVPAQLHDETPLNVTLRLFDERSNDICAEFDVRLDRSLMRIYARKFKMRHANTPAAKRDLYAPGSGSMEDQNTVTPEKSGKPSDAIGGDDAERRNPN